MLHILFIVSVPPTICLFLTYICGPFSAVKLVITSECLYSFQTWTQKNKKVGLPEMWSSCYLKLLFHILKWELGYKRKETWKLMLFLTFFKKRALSSVTYSRWSNFLQYFCEPFFFYSGLFLCNFFTLSPYKASGDLQNRSSSQFQDCTEHFRGQITPNM